MLKLYRDKQTGKKLYPVCSWEKNQHKLYNAHDRAWISHVEDDVSLDEVLRIEELIEAFESHVINGIVYTIWEYVEPIKDIIVAYDLRH